MLFAQVPFPTSPTARAAEQVVRRFAPEAMVNHCLRSYVFAAACGLKHGVDFDSELLFVAAMLHDLGLEPVFDSATVAFEDAGAAVAWVFAAGAAWPEERRERAGRAIIDHMRGDTDAAADPEGYLLLVATSLDIAGANADWWAPELRRDVADAYPRLDLPEVFAARFEDQAVRKPGCAAATSVRNGLRAKVSGNPLAL